jgi:hypothetical protein
MTPASRWQMTQRSVHTAQPGRPDCVEPPAPGCGRGAGPSSSVAAGGEGGAADASEGDGAGASDGGATAGASDGVEARGDAAGAAAGDDADDVGEGASAAAAARGAVTVPKANTAVRPTAMPIAMRTGAWGDEPRNMASPGRLPAAADMDVRTDGKHARQRRKCTQGEERCPASPSDAPVPEACWRTRTVLAARRRCPKW